MAAQGSGNGEVQWKTTRKDALKGVSFSPLMVASGTSHRSRKNAISSSLACSQCSNTSQSPYRIAFQKTPSGFCASSIISGNSARCTITSRIFFPLGIGRAARQAHESSTTIRTSCSCRHEETA